MSVTGTIEATQVDISPRITARIVERTVREGQPVERGQLLVGLAEGGTSPMGTSLTTYPVGRASLEIHHRKNPDAAWLDLVDQRVRKSAEEAATNGTTEDPPRFGMVLNRL